MLTNYLFGVNYKIKIVVLRLSIIKTQFLQQQKKIFIYHELETCICCCMVMYGSVW